MDTAYDVIIIGGGPGGCAASIYTARAKLKTLVLDQPGVSGMLEMAEYVANYPGVPGPLRGGNIIKTMREQATSFGAEYLEEVVIAVSLAELRKSVYTVEGGAYQANAVIIATGAHERTVKIPGEEKFWGRGVSECTTCDAPFYQDKIAMVVGDDEYAVLAALSLAKYARHVYFIAATETPAVPPKAWDAVQANEKIEVHSGWSIREIVGDEQVRGARMDTGAGEVTLAADGVFLYLGGSKPSVTYLQGQVPLDTDGAIIVNHDQATHVPLVYAVGDVTAGHVRQAVVAAGEGCVAALAAQRDLRGQQGIQQDYGVL